MTNSTFKTDYPFSLSRVNTLFHKLRQEAAAQSEADRLSETAAVATDVIDERLVLNSDFEATVDNGVKITLRAIKPSDYCFNEIVWETVKGKTGWKDTKCMAILDRNKSADFEKKTTITLYTEKFVISTRYGVCTQGIRDFVMATLAKYRNELETVKKAKIKKLKLKVY